MKAFAAVAACLPRAGFPKPSPPSAPGSKGDMRNRQQNITRRRFLEGTARGAGILAASGGSLAVSIRLAGAASPGKEPNPFALDVERLRKTDPKLIHYEQVGRFPCPNPNPRRIAIGPEGRVYIAAENSVIVLDRGGARVSEIACAAVARCVAVAADGTVYVGVRDHVEAFDRNGQRLAVWETPGKRTWISGLAVGEKDVFAADSGNRVILRYDRSGKLIGRIGEKNKDAEHSRLRPAQPVPGCGAGARRPAARQQHGPASGGGLHRGRRPGVLLGQALGGDRGFLRVLQPGGPGPAAGRPLCHLREGSAPGEGLLGGRHLRVRRGGGGILPRERRKCSLADGTRGRAGRGGGRRRAGVCPRPGEGGRSHHGEEEGRASDQGRRQS